MYFTFLICQYVELWSDKISNYLQNMYECIISNVEVFEMVSRECKTTDLYKTLFK